LQVQKKDKARQKEIAPKLHKTKNEVPNTKEEDNARERDYKDRRRRQR
jgi:hypothetical protein